MWILEPPNEELPEFGKLVAIAKYAHTDRMYHDLFVLKNKADGIVVSHEAAVIG